MNLIRFAGWRARLLSSRLRGLPGFIVIGAPRAGTTTVYRLLTEHPRVAPAWRQEVHFFNRTHVYERGLSYYRAFFPLEYRLRRDRSMTGEGTSVYMFRPNTAERIAAELPGVRLIAVLRDPVERAIASWQAFSDLGEESRSLHEAVITELRHLGPGESVPAEPGEVREDETRPDHVHKGRYVDQLHRWRGLFPSDQLHVMFSEELFSDPGLEMERAFRFLGLDPVEVSRPEPAAPSAHPEADQVRETLRAYYASPDRALEEMLGRALPWTGQP